MVSAKNATISSTQSVAIQNDAGGNVTIEGGTISTTSAPALLNRANQTTQNVTSQTETVDGTPQGITTTQGGSVSYQTPETPSVGQNIVTFNPDDYAIGDIRQSQ